MNEGHFLDRNDSFFIESDGVYGRVRVPASLCFVSTAQPRKLSLSASLGWAEEAQKRHARNSDGDAIIIEVLSYPLYVFGRFASLSWHLADRAGGKIGLATAVILFEGATAGVRCAMTCGCEGGCCPGRHSLRLTIYRLGGVRP